MKLSREQIKAIHAKKYTVRAITSHGHPIQPVITNRKNEAIRSVNWLRRKGNNYTNIRITNNHTNKTERFKPKR